MPLKLLFPFLLLFPASAWALQIIDLGGWSFTQRFQGTSNASGTVLKTDSTVGYAADRYMNLCAGLPLYFSRPDARVARRGSPEFLNGVGNLYVGVQTPVRSEVADYTSDIVVMAGRAQQSNSMSGANASPTGQ